MSRQLQSLLMALQVAQLVYAAATTSSSSSSSIRHHPLPMELYEVAHSHKGAHSDAISLHDLLIKEDHFQERSHPMSQLATGTDDEKQMPLGSRRHRKAAGRRQNHRQGRQMGTLESQSQQQQQPTVYYVAGTSSEEDLPVCAPNAVCSKIDVYDTPYIERQCRCPTVSAAPIIRQFRTDAIYNAASVQKHLENVQRNRPQRILDLNYNVRVPEEAYIKELIRKLRTVYEMPEILLEGEHATALEDRMLRKRQRVKAGNRNNDLDNTINNDHQTAFTKKTRHNHRGEVPKIGGCSALVGRGDGHTILDKTRQYKLCEPIHRLPECRNNFAYTWSVRTNSLNVTQQIVHCRCKKNSVTYLTKREALPNGQGYEFLFACAPQNEIRCLRKEPCKLFSVRKRNQNQDEVNTHPLCKCPREHSCPKHHTEAGVVGSTNYTKDNVMTYTAYCMADES